MKFLICGNLDAPDWILKEIEVLSKMSAIKFKLLCAEIIKILSGAAFDFPKIEKCCAGYDISALKAIVAAVTFMLRNAAKYNVKPEIVSLELQQLGLPKRHASDIEVLITTDGTKVRSFLKSNLLKLNRIKSLEWRVNFVLSSSSYQSINSPIVMLRLHIKENVQKNSKQDTKVVSFGVNEDKFRTLLFELKAAREIMKTL